MVEDLRVVGTLGQRVQPDGDRLLAVALALVEVCQGVPQLARHGTRLQQGLAQLHRLLQPGAGHTDQSQNTLTLTLNLGQDTQISPRTP